MPFGCLLCTLAKPMYTKVIKLDANKADSANIDEAVSVIDGGGLVAFPTETVYGIACRARIDSLARLDNLKGRSPAKHYTLHIGQKDDVKKYVPTVGLRAEKLIKLGKMTDAGLNKIEEAKRNGFWDTAYTNIDRDEMPEDLNKALTQNRDALNNFQIFANSY